MQVTRTKCGRGQRSLVHVGLWQVEVAWSYCKFFFSAHLMETDQLSEDELNQTKMIELEPPSNTILLQKALFCAAYRTVQEEAASQKPPWALLPGSRNTFFCSVYLSLLSWIWCILIFSWISQTLVSKKNLLTLCLSEHENQHVDFPCAFPPNVVMSMKNSVDLVALKGMDAPNPTAVGSGVHMWPLGVLSKGPILEKNITDLGIQDVFGAEMCWVFNLLAWFCYNRCVVVISYKRNGISSLCCVLSHVCLR